MMTNREPLSIPNKSEGIINHLFFLDVQPVLTPVVTKEECLPSVLERFDLTNTFRTLFKLSCGFS